MHLINIVQNMWPEADSLNLGNELMWMSFKGHSFSISLGQLIFYYNVIIQLLDCFLEVVS